MRSVILLVCLLVSTAYCKVFRRCELVEALKENLIQDTTKLATLVCIADLETNYNTKKVNSGMYGGGVANGLFQINDTAWCTNRGFGNLCRMNCVQFRDDDIEDDITCARIIIARQGLKAWKGCKNPSSYLKGC